MSSRTSQSCKKVIPLTRDLIVAGPVRFGAHPPSDCAEGGLSQNGHPPQTRYRGKRGFTLLEVLIAVTIVSLIAFSSYQTTSGVINSGKRAGNLSEVYRGVRVSLDKMTRDIAMAYLLSGKGHLGQKEGSEQIDTQFKGSEASLDFVSLSHLRLYENARESESCEIGYKLERDPDDDDFRILVRRESGKLDKRPEEGGGSFPMLKRVKRLELAYYDSVPHDWKNSWNSKTDEKLRLPRAVRITLTVGHPNLEDKELKFTTIAMVGMYNNAIDF